MSILNGSCGVPGCPVCNSISSATAYPTNNTCPKCNRPLNHCNCICNSLYCAICFKPKTNCNCGFISIKPNNPNVSIPLIVNHRFIHIMYNYSGPPITNLLSATCSKCKQTKTIDQIAYSYAYLKIARHLCIPCYIKHLDKSFGIETSNLEELLYGK
jgi:hypothetical protein